MNKYKTIDYPFTTGDDDSKKEKVLSVRNLAVSFKTDEGMVHAVRGVSFDLYKEETLCIVGESGSGKSVTNKAIMGILPKSARIVSGSILYEGEDLTQVSEDEFHNIRGTKIGMIFQDPLSSLNPIMKIGKQITEVMIINGDHMKNLYKDLVNDEFIKFKNDQRLVQIAKTTYKHAVEDIQAEAKKAKKEAKKANSAFDYAPFAEKLASLKKENEEKISSLKEVIAADKREFKKVSKDAKKKVAERRKALRDEHKANLKALRQGEYGKSMKERYDAFLTEHRRYISTLRVTHKEAKERALKIMEEVGIPEPARRFNQYPFEFSGGMRQRIVIAIALTAHPDVLICDEPTTALDVTIQAQILELINELKAKHHMSVIFITHDLGVVANMADRVAVMYAGKIVEYGTAKEVFYSPAHPYTWALLSSIPDIDSKEKLEAIPGTPPNMLFPPKGDAFAPRSKYAMEVDYKAQPPMFEITKTHYAATWLLDSRAPETKMPRIVSARIQNSLKKAGVNKQ